MATKNISITQEAYMLLLRRRANERESFSEIITREFSNKEKLRKLFGILKGKSGEEFEKNYIEMRKVQEKANAERIKRMKTAQD